MKFSAHCGVSLVFKRHGLFICYQIAMNPKLHALQLTLLLMFTCLGVAQNRSIQAFNVTPGNSAALNKVNLQKTIDWASTSGSALWVESWFVIEVHGALR